jgi:hypothetical protein
MQARPVVRVAYIHAWSCADSLKTFQEFYLTCIVSLAFYTTVECQLLSATIGAHLDLHPHALSGRFILARIPGYYNPLYRKMSIFGVKAAG